MRNYIEVNPGQEKALTIRITGKLPYNSTWAYQLDTSENNFTLWFDGNAEANAPNTPTSSSIKAQMNPTTSYFSFPDPLNFKLSKIRMFDGQGGSVVPLKTHLLLNTGEVIKGVVPDFLGSGYLQWIETIIPTEYQNVKAVLYEMPIGSNNNSLGLYPTELEFHGTYTPYNPSSIPVGRVKLKNAFGVNSFPWQDTGRYGYETPSDIYEVDRRLSKYDHIAWNRMYNDWGLFEHDNDDYRYAPTHTGGWNEDRGLTRLVAKGVKNIFDIKGIPPRIRDTYPNSAVSGHNYRDSENAYHYYKGNVMEYDNFESFPINGTTNPELFPYNPTEPTIYVAWNTQLAYNWNPVTNQYELRTENDPNVYLSVFTAEDGETIGRVRTYYNEVLDADRVNPTTYAEYGEIGFQTAARYGTNTDIDPSLIFTPDKVVGLGLLYAVEAGNENNAYWKGRKRSLNPYEFAAQLSAFYDGHKGTLGPRIGVKTADPNMVCANGGIVSFNPVFVRGMIDWCEEHRGYREDGTIDICWDIIKIHQYSHSGGLDQYTGEPRFAIPVDMNPIIAQKMKELYDLHYERLGYHVPVHIGETGYDNGPSEQSPPEINNTETGIIRTRQQSVGDWYIRDQIEWIWNGAHAVQFYLLFDPSYIENPFQSGSKYISSGMYNRDEQANPYEGRPNAIYSKQMQALFGEYEIVDRLSENPRVYKLSNGTNTLYALWIPDMIGSIGIYELDLPNTNQVTVYRFSEIEDDPMIETIGNIEDSKYIVDISEQVVFVKEGAEIDYEPIIMNGGQSNDYGSGEGTFSSELQGPRTNIYGTNTGTSWTTIRYATALGSSWDLNFAYLLEQHYPGKRINIVKRGVAGTILTPTEGVTDWHPTSEGEWYDNWVDATAAACANREAEGINPKIDCIFWHQGESNVGTAEYKQYQKDLIDALRADTRISGYFLTPNVPIVLVKIHHWGEGDHAGQDAINQAKEELAAEMANVYTISTFNVKLNTVDPIHIHNDGLVMVGERVFNKYLELKGELVPDDETSPTTPTNLRLLSKTAERINLAFDWAYDNRGIRGYVINIDGIDQPEQTDLNYSALELTPETSYDFKVKSIDLTGNESPYSNVLTVVTNEATVGPQLLRTYKTTFHGNAQSDSLGWNRMESTGATTIGYTAILNADDSINPLTMEVQKIFHSVTATEPSTGNESGIYPDIVLRTAYRISDTSGTTKCFKISGLNPNSYYQLDILGNTSAVDANTQYIVIDLNGDEAINRLITDQDLTSEVCLVKFINKQADTNGDIYLDIKNLGTSTLVHINAFVIREYDSITN